MSTNKYHGLYESVSVSSCMPSSSKSRRWKWKHYLILSFFLLVVSFGFLLNIFTYESLNFGAIRLAFQHLPKQWDEMKIWQSETRYGFMENATIAEWGQPELLNLSHFKWVINNDSLCEVKQENEQNIRVLVVLVHSARSHFSERLVIRKTWGSNATSSQLKNWTVRPAFLLGEGNPNTNTELDTENRNLTAEQLHFGDIIVGNFIDSYHNISYKHLMGYKWILNFCQNAAFILKVDDDAFIDVLQWIEWRDEDLEQAAIGVNVPSLYCFLHGGAKPRRNPNDKWFVSEEAYSDNFYPDYCMGGAYGMTVEYTKKIYSISNFAKFFWVDDVFVTGILREIAKLWFRYDPVIMPIWDDAITKSSRLFQQFCDNKGNGVEKTENINAVVFVPRGKSFEKYMYCLWNKILVDRKEH